MHLTLYSLEQHLAPLRRKQRLPDAAITFNQDLGMAEVAIGPLVVHAQGVGHDWRGTVTFSGRVLLALARVPTCSATTVINFSDGILRIGALTVPAKWRRDPVPIKRTRLPSPCIDTRNAPRESDRRKRPVWRCGRTGEMFAYPLLP